MAGLKVPGIVAGHGALKNDNGSFTNRPGPSDSSRI
jgi:hypothetical protein